MSTKLRHKCKQCCSHLKVKTGYWTEEPVFDEGQKITGWNWKCTNCGFEEIKRTRQSKKGSQAQKTAIKRLETIKNAKALIEEIPDSSTVIVSFPASFYGVYTVGPRGKTIRL